MAIKSIRPDDGRRPDRLRGGDGGAARCSAHARARRRPSMRPRRRRSGQSRARLRIAIKPRIGERLKIIDINSDRSSVCNSRDALLSFLPLRAPSHSHREPTKTPAGTPSLLLIYISILGRGIRIVRNVFWKGAQRGSEGRGHSNGSLAIRAHSLRGVHFTSHC